MYVSGCNRPWIVNYGGHVLELHFGKVSYALLDSGVLVGEEDPDALALQSPLVQPLHGFKHNLKVVFLL